MLLELGKAAFDDHRRPVLQPDFAAKISHAAPDLLRNAGTIVGENLARGGGVTKQARFFPHHVVLGGREADAVDFHSRGIPLTQALATQHAFLGRGRLEEEHIFWLPSCTHELTQLIDVTRRGQVHTRNIRVLRQRTPLGRRSDM
jgi:hypothetical protein